MKISKAPFDKFEKSYRFFLEKEKSGEGFLLEELELLGWKPSTIRTYLSKKWPEIIEKRGDTYFVTNISKYSAQEYVNLMSQNQHISQNPSKPSLSINVERLVIKAREAAMLALDIYNRPATLFKSEGYMVMMIIAWTALLHAIFEKKGIKYNYTNPDGTDKMIDGDLQAWEISTCLKEYYGPTVHPIKANLEFITGLRNKIEQRIVPVIGNYVNAQVRFI